MTSNNNLKQQARAYAAEHKVPYAQARREVAAQQQHPVPDGSIVRRQFQIQQEQREDGVLPYPFYISENGFVDRQDFWRGEPFRLVGFVDAPDSHDVTIDMDDFAAHPTAAIGKHPVLAYRDGTFFTYTGPVETVAPRIKHVSTPQTVTITAATSDGHHKVEFGVGHLMWLLNDRDFDGPVSEGRIKPSTAAEMLVWLLHDPAEQDLDALHDFFTHSDESGDTTWKAAADVNSVRGWSAARSGL